LKQVAQRKFKVRASTLPGHSPLCERRKSMIDMLRSIMCMVKEEVDAKLC
jgi:hypothetical protein